MQAASGISRHDRETFLKWYPFFLFANGFFALVILVIPFLALGPYNLAGVPENPRFSEYTVYAILAAILTAVAGLSFFVSIRKQCEES
ncbi:MAG: hypothetical protein A4E34_00392 [Methanoregula sp. PtaU1.Bin006]|nr:hypothetical protein [Methanoregula sp. PtaU1.Bin006]OPX63620.1 MAG: hypothetical protein A4E33_01555 [Methanoregula sp. PtaB.Bin085]OPY36214.1 MAG: hypothetical protein A4E34_00392 [Methanoregula sp. PtaU1.Bin006]